MAQVGKTKKFVRSALSRFKSARAKARARHVVQKTPVPSFFRKYPKFASFSLALGLSMLGANASAQTRHMGGVEPALSPAIRANVFDSQVSLLHSYPSVLEKNGNSFSKIRFSQRLSNLGPVAVIENNIANTMGSLMGSVQIGLAQRLKLGTNAVIDLGLLSPKLNDNPALKGMSFGVLFAHKGVVGEYHHANDANRLSIGYDLKPGFKPYIGVTDEGYYGNTKSIRLGANNVQKLLGINLGKVCTDFGLRFSEREKPVVDVDVFFPTKFGGVAFDVGGIGGPKEGVMASAWVVFNLGKAKK